VDLQEIAPHHQLWRFSPDPVGHSRPAIAGNLAYGTPWPGLARLVETPPRVSESVGDTAQGVVEREVAWSPAGPDGSVLLHCTAPRHGPSELSA
jgi:hypothetical protein